MKMVKQEHPDRSHVMNELMRELGKPDIHLAGLQIWVHGRQFPDAHDYWDGNRMNVTAHCSAPGSDVRVTGSFIHLSEILHFVSGAEALYNRLEGRARLPAMDPELSVFLEAKGLGQIEMAVGITPDHLSQSHQFTFEIDQSYLPGVISQCKKVLGKFPVRGSP